MNKHIAALLVFLGIFGLGSSQAATNNLWQAMIANNAKGAARPAMALAPDKYAQFKLDEPTMRSELTKAPARAYGASAMASGAIIPVPLPNGEMVDLVVEETDIMEAELAAKYPLIKVFAAYGAGQQPINGRLDFTEQGFHAMFNTEQGTVLIDPRTDASGARSYISYYKQDYHPLDKTPMSCQVHGDSDLAPAIDQPALSAPRSLTSKLSAARSGSQLSTYRLAVAATGEYTQFQGGSVSLALSAIVTTINRVNSVYERDMSIHLQLVNNNNLIIYTNAATDPYTNDDSSALLTQNQSNIDAVIGPANYDIGHVFGTGGGGLAQLQVPCGASKAMGETGSPQPIGDAFDIDYVAHEMGHQFGANHPFNGTTGSCGGGNRNAGTAWEPGSGSSIMAYAGICGGEDLQPHSDSMFHGGSINEIITFVTSGGGQNCGVRTATGDTAPVANAGPGYTIPANTPFVLTGSGTDVNTGDVLTYAWDEMDLGKASTATDMADEGTRPLFRSFVPSSSPARYFPKLDSLRNNVSDIGERLPTTNRQLKFRLTVRDQRGGVADSDVALTVTNSAGPFQVIAPNGGESLQTSTTATWNVANTNLAPVSCPSVGITLSTDSGASFPVSLLASTPNTGSATVTFPAGTSSTARLKIQCTNNIFFDISNNNFSYNSVGSSCRYALGASSASAAAGGLSGSVSVTTTTGCAWTASSNASWISISSGASGTGSGSVGYVVAANTGATTRSGTLTIAGQTFTVNQAAASVSAAVVQFAPTTYSVAESAGSVTLTVSRTGDTSGTATVAYSTCGAGCATLATATPGSDYTAASGTLSFGPGVSSQTISVPILNDNLVEGSETFTVTLSSPTGASLGAANAATVTILDGQTSQLILAGRLFNLPSPDNSDSGILRIYNGGSLPGLVTGTLYDQNGNVLGTADLTLTTSLAAKGALVLASSDLAARLGVNTWAGRAWIEIKSTLPAGTLLLQNLVRSTTLTNMSCVSDSVALNIPAVGNTDQAFIRLYNVGSTAGAIRGTLYDQSGSVLGNANSTLVSSLAGKAVTVLTADVIQSATGAPTWTGRAWLSMTADFGSNLKIMNLIRDSSNTLNNMSCVF